MPKIAVGGSQFFYQLDDFTDPWGPAETGLWHHGYARNHRSWYAWVPISAWQ